MPDLRALQSDLINYLVHKKQQVDDYIKDGGPIDKQTRLNIYSNAYTVRLRGVIDTDHQILSYYLGDELFDQLVEGYIDAYPSNHTSLREFCSNVPDYLKNNPPFNQYPVIAELARFEQTLLFAFDANDSTAASMFDLSKLSIEDWPNIKIRFHPSLQLFQNNYNCVEIWQALKQQQSPPDVQQCDDSTWVIWRNAQRVTEFRSLEISELESINIFLKGGSLSDVCENLLSYHPEEEVSKVAVTYLSDWLNRSQVSLIITEQNSLTSK
ncbi:MAG: putative DNA-binding domain-containing protein [Gammaproteobacteria bacterium]